MTVKLGLVGTGTVGGGCIDILKNHREEFKRHYGIDVELARVCSRNPEQAIAHGVEDFFTQDYQDILNDPDIDIVVELIGGTTVAVEAAHPVRPALRLLHRGLGRNQLHLLGHRLRPRGGHEPVRGQCHG